MDAASRKRGGSRWPRLSLDCVLGGASEFGGGRLRAGGFQECGHLATSACTDMGAKQARHGNDADHRRTNGGYCLGDFRDTVTQLLRPSLLLHNVGLHILLTETANRVRRLSRSLNANLDARL
jgi:hypothetical protein